jgi:hypothetical protein
MSGALLLVPPWRVSGQILYLFLREHQVITVGIHLAILMSSVVIGLGGWLLRAPGNRDVPGRVVAGHRHGVLMIIGLPQSMIIGVSRACRAIIAAGTGLGRGSAFSSAGTAWGLIRGIRWAVTAGGCPAGWSVST